MLVQDARGNELLVLTEGTTEDECPRTGALVVARDTAGALLLVHDVWRDQWELPGGGIEPGERSHETAAREVFEEAGQRGGGRNTAPGTTAYDQSSPHVECGTLRR